MLGQFSQTMTMLISFGGPSQESTRTAFCKYLATGVENLDERDFQTFSQETIKLLRGTHGNAHQPRPSLFSRTVSNALLTYVPQTLFTQQQPQQRSTKAKGGSQGQSRHLIS